MTIPPATALLLLPAILFGLEAGRSLRTRNPDSQVSETIENAVFALFGLLLAFTFSGAVARYDNHRLLLNQETNAIGTVYLRLDLLAPAAQPPLRQLMREYTASRLHLFDAVSPEVSDQSNRLQAEIWRQAVAGVSSTNAHPDAAKLLLPAINEMIDITSTRRNAFNMHPPFSVFLLLALFSCISAFMAGYSSRFVRRDWVYTLVLATTVTLTIYTTLEVEYPRQGLLRLSDLDRSLIELRSSMK